MNCSAFLFLTSIIQFGLRTSAVIENRMTSVERILEYGELKSEAILESMTETKLFNDGRIEFHDVSLR